MKNLIQSTALYLALLAFRSAATTYYVDINSPNPTPPYTSWSTAATNIQDAIAETISGDSISVNPGVYQSAGYTAPDGALSAVDVTNAITIQGVDGEAETSITGSNVMRCIYLANGATLTGFTLTNGNAPNGGGVYCASIAGTVISNCVITANYAESKGGGAYQGTLLNSAVLQNFAEESGGGGAYSAVLINCMVVSNSIFSGNGGGIECQSTECLISNCVIVGNSARSEGAGVYEGTLFNCLITGNSFAQYGGGACSSSLIDCTIVSNTAAYGSGACSSDLTNCVVAANSGPNLPGFSGGGVFGGNAVNCTITGNSSWNGGGADSAAMINCIVYYNSAYNNSSGSNYTGGQLTYCCTTPLPSGTGNIINQPLLASVSQISSNSPCRGAGNPAVVTGLDINGNPWANPPSIGCEEPSPGSMFGNITLTTGASATNITAANYPINFQANISGPVYNSVWNFGDGTVVSNTPYISHTWSALGSYFVTLTAYNDSYPNGVTVTNMIQVYQPTVFYVVATNSTPIAPYDSWAKAATNIQAAINVSIPGSLILVSNGVYNSGIQTNSDGANSRVAVTGGLTLQSVNGPTSTIINGGNAYRCVYLTNGAVLSGFTLTGGDASNGGGIYCASTNATITNCIITYCSAPNDGGGTYSGQFYNCSFLGNSGGYGGAAFGGAFENCTIASNSAGYFGGGIYSGPGCSATLANCLIFSNSANSANGGGGGIYNYPSTYSDPPFNCLTNCYLTNCVLCYNSSAYYGSAAVSAYLDNCTINSNKNAYVAVDGGYLAGCTLIGNQGTAAETGGSDVLRFRNTEVLSNCTLIANREGAYGCSLYGCTIQNNSVGALYSTLVNCLIVSNTAAEDGAGANNCTLTNCTLTFNQAANGYYGGGAYQSTLQNCTLKSNQAFEGGGADDCTLNNCTLIANDAGPSGGGGGAAGSILNQCLILQNIATNEGGGVMSCSLNNCLIISNVASSSYLNGPAYGGGAYLSTLTNCVLGSNLGTNGGGAYLSTLVNCTVTANIAILGGGSFESTNDNCILYYNNGGDYYPATTQYPLNYCCTLVSPGIGLRDITNAPLFVNLTGGDFHLQSSSPCINSGNNAYISSATDLDGNPRIQGGTVDIGAYEYQTPTSIISYAYLQQYGLPTDGSVDFADLDGTDFNVYQDWIAGLNPTNSASALAMLTPVTTNTATGVTVTWQSVTGIPYFLQRSTNLVSQLPFSTIQNNITGQTNTTSYIDTSATNGMPYFYRVGVVAP
jgi:hypothetical protein